MISTKIYWKYHVHKLELTLKKLKESEPKFNIENYFSGKNEMIYLVFLGNRYYRDKCARRSHLLSFLTKVVPSKVKFKWTKIKQKSFE